MDPPLLGFDPDEPDRIRQFSGLPGRTPALAAWVFGSAPIRAGG